MILINVIRYLTCFEHFCIVITDESKKSKVIRAHAVKTCGRWRYTRLRLFLTSTLGGSEWLTSHPGRFTPVKERRYLLWAPESVWIFLGNIKLSFSTGKSFSSPKTPRQILEPAQCPIQLVYKI